MYSTCITYYRYQNRKDTFFYSRTDRTSFCDWWRNINCLTHCSSLFYFVYLRSVFSGYNKTALEAFLKLLEKKYPWNLNFKIDLAFSAGFFKTTEEHSIIFFSNVKWSDFWGSNWISLLILWEALKIDQADKIELRRGAPVRYVNRSTQVLRDL